MASFEWIEAIAEAMFTDRVEQLNMNRLQQEGIVVYSNSLTSIGDSKLLMVKYNNERVIVATGHGELYRAMEGKQEGSGQEVSGQGSYKLCELTHDNRLVLNRYLEYTVPRAFGTQVATIGLGDRLGLASPGHIQTVLGKDVKPILAQQSIRELNLTGRDYKQVIDAAAFAVFQEGYKDGYGADGDHLKTEADIEMALELGFTMITLDCSDKINNDIDGMQEDELTAKYNALDESLRQHYEASYLGKAFDAAGQAIAFTKQSLMKDVLIYHEAIDYTVHIYEKYIQKTSRTIDFEISIDETLTPTDPSSHFLYANELSRRDVDIFSMAPRFCGEFQKGIDYIGDVAQFEQELIVHAAICDHFGYKLSVHSGSDKFSVFELVAKHTKGRFHLKTAGTNWLEAMRTIARVHPQLYRDMHSFALEHVEEALAYYHVSADFKAIEPLESMSDEQLPNYMDDDNARQLIHITYGLLLQAKDEDGRARFKDDFYATLLAHEQHYEQAIQHHIGKHLQLLGK